MDAVFLRLVNLSITASFMIAAVLLLRPLLRRTPKWTRCLLWGIVALRLICPFSLESALSLVPSAATVPETILNASTPAELHNTAGLNILTNPTLPGSLTANTGVSVDRAQIFTMYASFIWAAGLAVLLIYALVSYTRLRLRVREAVRLRDGVWLCDTISTPFILGIIRPRIYLPSALDEAQTASVIAHESTHLARRDQLWKPLGFALLAVYWFNPLIWLAYALLCRDIELACDERVIKELRLEEKKVYSEALLACAAPRRLITACPLAFGEVGVKERVKTVLSYKKPAFWVIIAAVVVCIVVAVCFLTKPKQTEPTKSSGDLSSVLLDGSEIDLEAGEELLKLMEDYDVSSFIVGADDPNSDSKAVELRYSDGRFDLLHYYYYGGIIGSEFRAILTQFDAAGAAEAAWKLDAGFNPVFENWADKWKPFEVFFTVEQWFDYLGEGSVPLPWDSSQEAEIAEFPGVTFRWTPVTLTAVEDGVETELFTGMPIWSVYFTDLTGDGKPELCATASFGSGLIDERIIVYDYVEKQLFELSDRGRYDYRLRFEEEKLYVDKRANMQDEVLESGHLALADGKLTLAGTAGTGGADEADAITTSGETLYRYSFTVFISPLSSFIPTTSSGYLYGFDEDGLTIYNESTGAVYATAPYDADGWEALSAEHWAELFVFGNAPDISGIHEAQYNKLSGRYYLFNMDGSLWLGDYRDEKVGLWSVYELTDSASAAPAAAAVTTDLDEAIHSAILSENWSGIPNGLLHCESHVLLASETGADGSLTAYVMALYMEFSVSGGSFSEEGGSHIPTALTFDIDGDGVYTLREYWQPRDGSYYPGDIRDRFPKDIAEDALDTQKFITAQMQDCYRQVIENAGLDAENFIVPLIDAICSSPAESSNPGDYIAAHSLEYRELLYYGEYTLDYCYAELARGGHGLREQIFLSLVNDLAGDAEALD